MAGAITPKSGNFTCLDDTTMDRMWRALPRSFVDTMMNLAYLGGAAGQVTGKGRPMATAAHPFVMICWRTGRNRPLTPKILPGFADYSTRCVQHEARVYINLMSGDEQDRVPEAYHERWDRMVASSPYYDPIISAEPEVPPSKIAAKNA